MAKTEKKAQRDLYLGCYGPKLTYNQILKYLKDAFEADNYSEQNNPNERFSTCIWGNPGCGKTSLIRSLEKMPIKWEGKEYEGFKVVYLPLAQFEEMGDLLGLPTRNVCMTLKDKEEWIPETCIEGYHKLGWNLKPERGVRTMCAPPAWVPTEERPTIILIDDWNRASLRIIKGCMQLLQTYGTATWSLPRGSHIVLTGNPDLQDFQVTSIDSAVLTRIRNVTMLFDERDWSLWAQNAGLDGRGISWCLYQPEMMIGKERTNPRTISECFRMTSKIGDLNVKENEERFRMIANSLLDEETVANIIMFMQTEINLVAEPEKIIDGTFENIEKYITDLMSTKNGKEARTDIVGIITQRLFSYISSDRFKEDSQKHIKNFQNFITIAAIPEDLKFYVINQLLHGDKSFKLCKFAFKNEKIDGILKKLYSSD